METGIEREERVVSNWLFPLFANGGTGEGGGAGGTARNQGE